MPHPNRDRPNTIQVRRRVLGAEPNLAAMTVRERRMISNWVVTSKHLQYWQAGLAVIAQREPPLLQAMSAVYFTQVNPFPLTLSAISTITGLTAEQRYYSSTNSQARRAVSIK